MPISMPVRVVPVAVLIVVLAPLRRPWFTLGFFHLVLSCMPEITAAAAATAVNTTTATAVLVTVGIMLVTVKIWRGKGLLHVGW